MQEKSYNFLKSMPPKAKAGLRKQAIEAVVGAVTSAAVHLTRGNRTQFATSRRSLRPT